MKKPFSTPKSNKNNQLFKDFFEHIATGLIICDTDGFFIEVNEPFCKLTGYSPVELKKMSFQDITHPDDLSKSMEQLNLSINGKLDNYSIEKRYIRKDNTAVWVRVEVSFIKGEGDSPNFLFGTVMDILNRKKAEERLAHSKKDWQHIFQAIGHPAILLDKSHKIIDVNNAVIDLTGKTKTELLSQPCYKIFHGKNSTCPASGCPMSELIRSGRIETLEMEMEVFNGTFLVTCTPLFDENDELKNIIHIATDVTRLKKIEKALQESEARYRTLLDSSPFGIVVYVDNKIVFINPAGYKVYGAETREEIIGINPNDLIHPDNRDLSEKRLKRLLNGEMNVYPTENKYLRLDGKPIDVEVYAIKTEYQGKPAVQFSIVDITERKIANESKQEWERRFTNIMQSVNLVSIILNSQAKIIFCNQYILDITGYKEEDLIDQNYFDIFIHKKDKEEIKHIFTDGLKNGYINPNHENNILTKTGEILDISWSNTLLRNTDGEVIGTASIGENITERKSTETSLRKTQLILSRMGKIAKIGGWEFDTDTMQGTWTEEVARIHELPTGMATNVELAMKFYKGKSKEKIEKAIKAILERGTPYDLELKMTTAKGNTKWVRTIANAVKSEGKVIKIVGSFQDITERVLINQQLIKAKEKAEESDRLKSIFLANMSHEVRTPLNAIIGFSTLLDDTSLTKQQRDNFINIIAGSGDRLTKIINDIIDISKLESNQLSLDLETHSFYEIIENSIKAFKNSELLNNKPEVSLLSSFPEELKSIKGLTDKVRLQQVLDNIITNAIKYTEKGFIEVGIKLVEEDNEQALEIYVKDTGFGIQKEKYNLIFEIFRQVEENTYHKGTGLGLSISKGILQLMGGKIWFTSEFEKGTTFFFTVPIQRKNGESGKHKKNDIYEIDIKDKTIIIAEDDHYSFLYLEELLKSYNPNIIHAENGQILMNILENTTPDLILLDINMPIKTGLECLKEIRGKGLDVKIIGQTAYAMSDEREKCYKAGCNGYISKPIKKEKLFQVISQVLNN